MTACEEFPRIYECSLIFPNAILQLIVPVVGILLSTTRPMKVIVCFDSVRVIVPCGDGEILVRELIIKAIHRYRKATGKAGSHWVDVLNLKTISGGGILDPDDQLNDVCDDREQLIADFEEEGRPPHHNGGDGASASSTGTTSPDIFQEQEEEEGGTDENDDDCQEQGPGPPISHLIQTITNSPTFPLIPRQENGKNDIIVTTRDLTVGSSLRVRRGSEPALSTLGDDAIQRPLIPINNGIIALHRRESVRESDEPCSDSSDEENSGKDSLDRRKKALLARFSRDAFRTSLSNRPEMFVWMEAQEKQETKIKQAKEERKGPVGASTAEINTAKQPEKISDCIVISLSNDGGPLGIHVVPASDDNGRDMGLMIQSVEPGGRIHKDGRLSQGDRIVEINNVDLASATFTKAQDIFRSAMKTDEIRLKVIKMKKKPKPAARNPPAIMPKPRGHAPAKPSPLTLPQKNTANSSPPTSPNKTSAPSKKQPSPSTSCGNGESKQKTFFVSNVPKTGSSVNGTQVPSTATPIRKTQPIKPTPPEHVTSPTKKTPPAVPVRHPTTSLTSQTKERPINALTNTRKIGKKIQIDLRKGPLGLGFSVTSRDNMTGGDVPIYIKNILPKGAAIQDGRLKPGDRLLEVNDISMMGKTQAEVVTMLRNTPQGSVVSMVVSRQEEVDERFTVPRELAQSQPPHLHIGSNSLLQNGLNVEEKNKDDVKSVEMNCEDDEGKPLQPSDRLEEDLCQSAEKLSYEVIKLDIPLNDTGSAGLGVSVKGKTVTTEGYQKDLGIFVKGVIAGGAASKDGRLQLNDQLLEVNGIPLKGLPNVAAMESLRYAMTTEGPLKGHIQLTVARKARSSSPFPLSESSHDSSQNEIMMRHYRTRSDLSQTSDYVDSPHHSRQSSTSKLSDTEMLLLGDKTSSMSSLEKLGHSLTAAGNVRNDSYLKATNDTLSDSSAFTEAASAPGAFRSLDKNRGKMTIIPRSATQEEETTNEEEDQYSKSQLKQRPHSTIGFFGMEDETEEGQQNSVADESDLSPTSPLVTFNREGFGRQSMSEKRKGHMDPRNSEVYQRAKASKDHKDSRNKDRNQYREGAVSAGSTLVRSGSLESLPTTPITPDPIPSSATNTGMLHDFKSSVYRPQAVRETPQSILKRTSSVEDMSQPGPQAEIKPEELEETQALAWRRLGRVRTCNESFRAAVDRSYDPLDSGVPMDTLEEESMESGSFSVGQRSTSGRSSFSSENAGDDYSSLKKKKVKDKKGGGRLLGFFRLVKGRKSMEDIGHTGQGRLRSRSEERPSHLMISRDPETEECVRKLSQQSADDSRLQEQYRRIQEQQQQQLLQQREIQQQLKQQQRLVSASSLQSDAISNSRSESPFTYQQDIKSQMPTVKSSQSGLGPSQLRIDGVGGRSEGSSLAGAAASRAEHMLQLRRQHQQQHLARQGIYPIEQDEDIYEQNIPDNDRRLKLAAEVHHKSRGAQPVHHNLRAEIHHDSRMTDSLHQEPHVDEIHHYHNSRLSTESYPESHARSEGHHHNLRADIHMDPRVAEIHKKPHGEVVHNHRADVHRDPLLAEGLQDHLSEIQHQHVEVHSDPRREMAHDPRSHLAVYETGSNYSHQFSRPTSQQSETCRNSPYPSVSSMGSDASHPCNYPTHSSHTLTGYDPHLLHHHHHHHHHPHAHHQDVYESHYGSHEGRASKRESYVDRQRQYYDETHRGFQDPHRSGYSTTQRTVQRFADPGSAKV